MMRSWRKTYRRLAGRSVLFQSVRSALMSLAGALGMPDLHTPSTSALVPFIASLPAGDGPAKGAFRVTHSTRKIAGGGGEER